MPKLQRLLYINSESTHPQSPALSAALYEPVAGSITQVDPTSERLPYDSVHAAIIDGWRVIQAPDVWSGIGTEGAGEVIGFQFILEKNRGFRRLKRARPHNDDHRNINDRPPPNR